MHKIENEPCCSHALCYHNHTDKTSFRVSSLPVATKCTTTPHARWLSVMLKVINRTTVVNLPEHPFSLVQYL